MQIFHAAFILMLAVSGGAGFGQATPGALQAPGAGASQPQSGGTAPAAQPAGAAPPAGSAAPVHTASSMLKPSLTVVQDTLNGLKLDKWKKGSVREEAGEHVNSLLKDLQTNLPTLITAADAASGSLSQAIPLTKHMDAFYDVLLRVEEAARVSGPPEQVAALQQAMLQLNQARLALDDQLQAQAAAQEKQVGDLQGALKTARADAQAKAAAAAAPVPCKPAPPAKKKSTKKPATTPPNATPAKPGAGTNPPAKPAPGAPSGQKTP